MNRRERRAAGIKAAPPTYVMNQQQIDQMKREVSDRAIESAVVQLMGLPLIALRDAFGFGTVRLCRFMDEMMKQIQLFHEGYMTLADLVEVVKDETGVILTLDKDGNYCMEVKR